MEQWKESAVVIGLSMLLMMAVAIAHDVFGVDLDGFMYGLIGFCVGVLATIVVGLFLIYRHGGSSEVEGNSDGC